MVSWSQRRTAAVKAVNRGFAVLNGVKKELDRLDRRVSARKREFKGQGEFSDVHAAFLENVVKRQAAIRKKIDKALDKGMSFALLKAEFERDLNGLSGQVLRWEERLDAQTMKTRTKAK